MSVLLGVLQVVGKGGNELFVFDDALVRASTGLGAALLGSLDSSTVEGASAIKRAFAGKETLAAGGPEELLSQGKSNVMVWRRDIASATLTRGRWPSTGLRRLTVLTKGGSTLVYSWPGEGATRPLNSDGYAVPLLTGALPGVLDVQLPS